MSKALILFLVKQFSFFKMINKVLSTKDLPSVNSKHTCNPRNSKLANFSNTHVKCIGNLNEIKIDSLDRTHYV